MALAFVTGAGCAQESMPGSEVTNQTGDAPLSELSSLFDGVPDNAKLPDEGKTDATYPAKFIELLATQAPVRSQAKRGVCSIFATIALMEHLYMKEGTISMPDFSEQYLQWSAKVQVGSFPHTDGSNASSNLDAISRFGIVEESAWPYEASPWNETNDAACKVGEENLPTKCYTNGEPPASAMSAKKWRLPTGRWINSSANSIKAHMTTRKQGAVVGLTFFHQSWNHRASTLPTNNDFWRQGYVTYPNEADKAESLKKRAGHAILLVGWDDELAVQKRDGEGKLLTGTDGKPQVEKGFFIFKNSWGTGSFGVNNPHGDGYGFLSMQYVKEYGTVYVSDVPEVTVAEVCNDGKDNDGDQKKDCADSDCSANAACAGTTITGANTMSQSIPDNNPSGIKSDIVIAETGMINALSVTVDITHPYQGDLTVKLEKDGTSVVLHEKTGGGADNLQKTFAVTNFNGKEAAGTWTLVVIDSSNQDVGKLNSFALSISKSGMATKTSYANTMSMPIPDNKAEGIFSNIEVKDAGNIKGLSVDVDIKHSYKGDLSIKLQRFNAPGEIVLQAADGSSGAYEPKTYTVSGFNGQDATGTWRLIVADTSAQDAGTLNKWSLEVVR